MTGRLFELLKYAVLAFALLNLTMAAGCGDNAAVEPEIITEDGGANDPEKLMEAGEAEVPR